MTGRTDVPPSPSDALAILVRRLDGSLPGCAPVTIRLDPQTGAVDLPPELSCDEEGLRVAAQGVLASLCAAPALRGAPPILLSVSRPQAGDDRRSTVRPEPLVAIECLPGMIAVHPLETAGSRLDRLVRRFGGLPAPGDAPRVFCAAGTTLRARTPSVALSLLVALATPGEVPPDAEWTSRARSLGPVFERLDVAAIISGRRR